VEGHKHLLNLHVILRPVGLIATIFNHASCVVLLDHTHKRRSWTVRRGSNAVFWHSSGLTGVKWEKPPERGLPGRDPKSYIVQFMPVIV